MALSCCNDSLSGTVFVRDRPDLVGFLVDLTASLPYTGAGSYTLQRGATANELFFKFGGNVTLPPTCDTGRHVITLAVHYQAEVLSVAVVPIPACGAGDGIEIALSDSDLPVQTGAYQTVDYTVTTDPTYTYKPVTVRLPDGQTVVKNTDGAGEIHSSFNVYYDCREDGTIRTVSATRKDTGAASTDVMSIVGPCVDTQASCCDSYRVTVYTAAWTSTYEGLTPDANGGLVFGGPAPMPTIRLGPNSSGCPRTGTYQTVIVYGGVSMRVAVNVVCENGSLEEPDPGTPGTPPETFPPYDPYSDGVMPDCPESFPGGVGYATQTSGILRILPNEGDPNCPDLITPCPEPAGVYSEDGTQASTFCSSCLNGEPLDATVASSYSAGATLNIINVV